MSKPFEIKNMREARNCGSLKATFTAAFKALELNDCRLIEGRDGLFFAPPSRQYENRDGETKYANYFYVTDDRLKGDIEAEAIAVYEKMADRPAQGQQRSEGGGYNHQNEPPCNPDDDIPFAHRYDWLERTWL